MLGGDEAAVVGLDYNSAEKSLVVDEQRGRTTKKGDREKERQGTRTRDRENRRNRDKDGEQESNAI